MCCDRSHRSLEKTLRYGVAPSRLPLDLRCCVCACCDGDAPLELSYESPGAGRRVLTTHMLRAQVGDLKAKVRCHDPCFDPANRHSRSKRVMCACCTVRSAGCVLALHEEWRLSAVPLPPNTLPTQPRALSRAWCSNLSVSNH